ncbi:dTDP-4-dehydrorhamnose 3,5-epimerase [Prochlorococcus sp. MIT 1300]|uniref:dTDP-4-dehydrorhamnose 3,5-epimerase n=1 Tax=Prochlorococcus sp. MIT 1300 TaxID=3096218 RepID=UPI002A75698F|nr:dTDP-4-dehydrorhamnose 3,5-epimerase [Prochlorococcus sp. MIT 1300]
MEVKQLSTIEGLTIQGPLLLQPRVYGDDRGFFFESWNQLYWNEVMDQNCQSICPFVQDNHSRSVQGVLRGLHYQLPPNPQGKLVRCLVGEIFDVAVDLRLDSETKGLWVGRILTSENKNQLWIPAGFAHGFLTLSTSAEVHYKTTDFWNRDCERSIRWNDPDLSIAWPDCSVPITLSDKDKSAPFLKELNEKQFFS